eukprot:scaffold85648_cov54-Phaeocystis_antarctica.AAC.2
MPISITVAVGPPGVSAGITEASAMCRPFIVLRLRFSSSVVLGTSEGGVRTSPLGYTRRRPPASQRIGRCPPGSEGSGSGFVARSGATGANSSLALVLIHHIRSKIELQVVHLDGILRRLQRHDGLPGDWVERIERDGDVGPVASKGPKQVLEPGPEPRNERQDGWEPTCPQHQLRPTTGVVAGSSAHEGRHAAMRRRFALVFGSNEEAGHDHLVAHFLADVAVLDDAVGGSDPACVERLARPDARVDEKGECAKDAGRKDDLASAIDHLAAVPRLRDHA